MALIGGNMYNAKDIAMYLLQLDIDNKVFNLEIVEYSDRKFYGKISIKTMRKNSKKWNYQI